MSTRLTVAVLLALACTGEAPIERSDDGTRVSATDRERIRSFWSTFRAATRARIDGALDTAVVLYRQALEYNPGHEDALYYLGNVQLERGEFADAVAAWRRLTGVNPQSARGFTQLGRIQSCHESRLFDLQAAEQALERAASINPEQIGAFLRLGEVALLRRDTAAAGQFFAHVRATDANSVAALFYSGYLDWQNGDTAAARRQFRAAVTAARPKEATEGVAGEGDTRTGTMPLLSEHQYCRAFEEQYAGLDQVADAQVSAEMDRRYRAVRSWLATEIASPD